jgi:osmotically-inducible protein OsmY
MRSFNTWLLLGAAAILAFSGCKSSTSSSAASGGSEAKKINDRGIVSDVKSELNRDPVYKFDDVNVSSADGIVQLSGFATTEEQKQRAGQLAQSVDGVTKVDNAITLKPQALPKTGRPAYPTDTPSTQ